MNDEIEASPDGEDALLRLLEDPHAPELEDTRRHLATSPEARRALRELMALEDALLSDAWRDAEAAARAEPPAPLPLEMRDRLLAIAAPVGAARPALPSRPSGLMSLLGAGTPRRRAARFAMAAVALVGLSLGARVLLQGEGSRMRGVPTAPGDALGEPPFVLVARRGADAATSALPLALGADGTWRAQAPLDSAIQLRLRPADGAGPADPFTASLTVSLTRADGARTPLSPEPFTAQGTGADVDIAVGPTIRLSSLSELGAAPGDTLELDVRRGAQTQRLVVVLGAPSP